MTQIGVRELRENLSAVLRRVRSGETVVITSRGEAVALLSAPPQDRYSRLLQAGAVTLPREPLRLDDLEPLPQTGSMSASAALEDDRSAER